MRATAFVAAIAVTTALAATVPARQAARPSLDGAGAYALESVWPAMEADSEPIGVAVAPDGSVYTVQAARGAADRFPGIVRRDASGAAVASFVVRDASGMELRPLAVSPHRSGLFATTEDLLLALGPDGRTLWEAPAGDGRPEFGPAARGLVHDGDLVFGSDFVNGRVLGYDASDGRLRLRLGTVGTSPGTYRGPIDVAVGAGGTLYVADHGNRSVQVLDPVGNPLARFALPASPRALAVDADGGVVALLADERVLVLDPTGLPLLSFGAPGHGPGEMHLASDVAVDAAGRILVADRGNRRVQVFRPVGSASPVTPTPTSDATPGVTEPPPAPSHVWDACPGRPATFTLAVDLPAAPPRLDVLLAFDTTGSMEGVIDVARTRALEIAAELGAVAPDAAVGVLDVRDYPYGRAGLATDWPYALRGPLSTIPADLARATGLLRAAGGGDAPEAYAGGIAWALGEPRTGWREGARKVVVVLGDSVPRDDDLNEAVASPLVAGRWAPGLPAWWRDSGADWVPGTTDDIDWTRLLQTMRAGDVTLVALVSGAAPEALAGRVDALVAYWQAWAGMAGPNGSAMSLAHAADLPELLGTAAAAVGLRVDRLHVAVAPPDRASWALVDPPDHRDIDTAAGGARRAFSVALAPPPGTVSGSYPFELTALGDGAAYAQVRGVLRWRSPCAPLPTDAPEPTPTVPPSPSMAPTNTPTASDPPPASATPARAVFLPRALKAHETPGQRRKADIVLVLDTSSSMAGAKLEAAVSAAVSFVGLLALPDDHAAVVTFDSAARLAAPLAGSRQLLLEALGATATGIGTRLDLGLIEALEELTGPRARPDATPVVIVLTDGRPDGGTENAARLAAERAHEADVTVFAIGLGEDADMLFLRDVASDPTRLYYAPDETELAALYARIAGGLP